jgi:hypothetical protein
VTSVTVTVPAGATTGTVTVTTSGGSAGSQQPFVVDAPVVAPVVSGFTPSVVVPGVTVTVSGSGFDANPANDTVSIGAVRAAVKTATSTSLTVTVPVSAGSGPVTVVTAGGSGASSGDLVVVPSGYVAADVVATPKLAVDGPRRR